MRYGSKRDPWLALLFVLLVIAFQLSMKVEVHAEGEDEQAIIIDEQIRSGQVQKIQEQLKKHTSDEFRQAMPEFDPQSIVKDAATGNFKLNIPSFLNKLLMVLFKEIYINLGLLIKLVVIAIFCAVLRNLQTSFLSDSVGELAFYACYIVIVSILVLTLNTAFKLGQEIIDGMVVFMHATIPVLVTLMISGGNVASGGILQPLLIMMVEVAAAIFKNLFLPMIFLTAVLSIVDNVSEKVQISKLTSFIKQINTWSIGIILTIFIAAVSLQGSLGAVVDGVTSKTAKFALGAFIPVAGKYLADAAETVIACTLLIKNAAGIAVMVGIIAICLVPLLKILAIITLYRITCVLIEPISEKRITNCINDMASSLTYILGVAASVAFMFLISITAIISAGNIAAMVR